MNIKLSTKGPQCSNFKFQILIQNVSIVGGKSIDITKKESMAKTKQWIAEELLKTYKKVLDKEERVAVCTDPRLSFEDDCSP